MNEMRKLMEAVKGLSEDWDDEDEHYSMKYAEVEKFQGRKIIVTDLYDGDVYGILDNKHGPRFMVSTPLWRDSQSPSDVTMDEIEVSSPTFDIDQKDEAFLKQWTAVQMEIDEAYQGGKTEHSGAKHGKGAYYGRKKDAKRDSNKNRRRADKASAARPVELSLGEELSSGEYDDEPGATKYTRQYGNVTVNVGVREVLITHGYGENIFLSIEEWREFVEEIQDILI